MAFPNAPRVLYEVNPLDEVTCRLRFPPILRIDAEAPVAFQELVRADFPFYQVESSVKLPSGLPDNLSRVVQRDLAALGSKSHNFDSADRSWQIKLTRDSLLLRCRRYERWEQFRQRLISSLDALSQVYVPAFFVHVCVRYRDVVRRSRLQIPGEVPWSELIQPWMCGPLSQEESAGDVESTQTKTVIRLPDELGRVDASYGLAVEEPGKVAVFLIDAHLFNELQTVPSDVIQRLNALNRQAGLFFRWCITDRLHRAMRPREVPSAGS